MKRDENLNRREALKLLGMGSGLLFGSGASSSENKVLLSRPASHKKARIVIAGGGTAGMIAAARARRAAPNAQIVLICPNETHLYQSGQLFVAAGLEREEKYMRKTADLVPDDVTWIREKVISFDPDRNSLQTQKSGKVVYDLLIVALGAEYDYGAIDGLSSDMIGKEGIASLYLNDTIKGTARGGSASYGLFSKMMQDAKTAKTPLKVLFTEPASAIKGEGTSLSLLLLYKSFLEKEFADKNVHFTFAKAGRTLLPSVPFDKVLKKELKKHKNIDTVYDHDLVKIDPAKKTASFKKEGDHIEMEYDYIHIVPPLRAPEVVRKSLLSVQEGAQKGWMQIDEKRLRHKKYRNVFGIGDVTDLLNAKSGAAAQHQGIILQDNIAAALEGEALEYFYDGYTACAVVTSYGKALLAEYNEKKPLATFMLDPYEPRMLWWWLQRYFMPWAYFNLLMRGMM